MSGLERTVNRADTSQNIARFITGFRQGQTERYAQEHKDWKTLPWTTKDLICKTILVVEKLSDEDIENIRTNIQKSRTPFGSFLRQTYRSRLRDQTPRAEVASWFFAMNQAQKYGWTEDVKIEKYQRGVIGQGIGVCNDVVNRLSPPVQLDTKR